ncbi:hypothetical protein [Aquabacterium sp.]|uniref:hypothetical protein n=1 Tax=Aquabacterium sp. TaxID=1872578 RepID=UPI0025C6471E|nr:hypothetical protein [Aquabacterium sp.]
MQVEQQQARLDKLAHDEEIRSFHGYVYAQLQSPRKDEILRRAAERIDLWQRNKLCSSYYIRFWSSVVKAGDSETFKAKVLNAPKRRADAMMQNTPFSFLMRERS